MAEKRQDSGFTVTDRRLFTEDGELRKDVSEEVTAPRTETPAASAPAAKEAAPTANPVAPFPPPVDEAAGRDMPLPPSAAEQQAQADAYRESSKDLDARVELSGRSAKEFEMTFERFRASLYMTAMLKPG